MKPLILAIAMGIASHAAVAQDARPPASSAFDGRWNVTLVCEDLKEKGTLVKGYEFRFVAEISGGQLKGQYGSPGSPSSVLMVGNVAADGALEIRAEGYTGKSDHTVGRVAQGTRYHYSMEGRLAGTEGSARRRELRPCTASFVKA